MSGCVRLGPALYGHPCRMRAERGYASSYRWPWPLAAQPASLGVSARWRPANADAAPRATSTPGGPWSGDLVSTTAEGY